jgi:hypothetical protein
VITHRLGRGRWSKEIHLLRRKWSDVASQLGGGASAGSGCGRTHRLELCRLWAVQHELGLGLDEPQIQLAEDAVTSLDGTAPDAVAPSGGSELGS